MVGRVQEGIRTHQFVRTHQVGFPGLAHAVPLLHDVVDGAQGELKGHHQLHLSIMEHRLGHKGAGFIVAGRIGAEIGHAILLRLQHILHEPAQVGIGVFSVNQVAMIIGFLGDCVKTVAARVDQKQVIIAIFLHVIGKKVILRALYLCGNRLFNIDFGNRRPVKPLYFQGIVCDHYKVSRTVGVNFLGRLSRESGLGIRRGYFIPNDIFAVTYCLHITSESRFPFILSDQIGFSGLAHAVSPLYNFIDGTSGHLKRNDPHQFISFPDRRSDKSRKLVVGGGVRFKILQKNSVACLFKTLAQGAVLKFTRLKVLPQVGFLGGRIDHVPIFRNKKQVVIAILILVLFQPGSEFFISMFPEGAPDFFFFRHKRLIQLIEGFFNNPIFRQYTDIPRTF